MCQLKRQFFATYLPVLGDAKRKKARRYRRAFGQISALRLVDVR
jgi:hypothetical protein